MRQTRAVRQHVGGMARHVAFRSIAFELLFLEIDRKRDVRDAAVQKRGSTRQVGDVLDVARSHDAHAVLRDVHEDFVQLDILLREGPDQIVKRHPGNSEHRHVVKPRVVETGNQMRCART